MIRLSLAKLDLSQQEEILESQNKVQTRLLNHNRGKLDAKGSLKQKQSGRNDRRHLKAGLKRFEGLDPKNIDKSNWQFKKRKNQTK